MEKEYERKTEEVMAYLAQRESSERTIRRYRKCFAELAEYLRKRNLVYSNDVAWEWLSTASPKLDKTTYAVYVSALGKLGDLYTIGEIKPLHRRASKMVDRLCVRHRQLVDDYCDKIKESGRAGATVYNHRVAIVRFLLSLEEGGVEFVADASYADLIRILVSCEEMTYYAKTEYRGKIRSILAYLYSEGLVGFGFTLLADAMTLKKGYCWNSVDQKTIASLRAAQDDSDTSITPEDFLSLVYGLAEEHREHGYSHGAICNVVHFGNLLFLFMDANELKYNVKVGRIWMASMEPSLSRGEYSACRRIVMLLELAYKGIAYDPSRVFRFGPTLRERLPEWCAADVDLFLSMKASEGWRRSTLVMFRTCVCRFCLFVDSIGITDFTDLTAMHVKIFNRSDVHATPGGKNAFNSRIRQFLDWLGSRGKLSNPYLFLALANVAAPAEKLVVTLTPEEQEELKREIGDGDGTSLRDKAMLQLGLRMGIRASDVVGLAGEDIDWNKASARFVQVKTGYEVELPMPTDVANALYRYIADERPQSGEEAVFLRSKAPYGPLRAGAAQRSLSKALPARNVPGSGFHTLRKTFASNMLESGAEPHQVAEALGHRSLDNVHKYLHLDGQRMRLCGLSLKEAGLVMGGGFSDGA